LLNETSNAVAWLNANVYPIDLSSEVSGLLTGDYLAEDTIAARHMVITDFENLWPDGSCESFEGGAATDPNLIFGTSTVIQTAGADSRGGDQNVRLFRNNGTNSCAVYTAALIPVEPGEHRPSPLILRSTRRYLGSAIRTYSHVRAETPRSRANKSHVGAVPIRRP